MSPQRTSKRDPNDTDEFANGLPPLRITAASRFAIQATAQGNLQETAEPFQFSPAELVD
ncbi:MAG: hypothetical protein ACYC3X_15465 [Pirellulaceae bacterium]